MEADKKPANRCVVKLRIADEMISVGIKPEDEGKARMAAKLLNEKVETLRRRYKGARGQTLLAYIAFERFLNEPLC